MKIILIGDSGHGKVIADNIVSMGNHVVAKLDDKYTELIKEENCWIGPVSEVHVLIEQERAKVVVAIGSNRVRQKVVRRLSLGAEQYATIIHKEAIISPSAVIGNGTVVMPGVIVNAAASIGNHAILNTGAVVEHDCEVRDYAHISPGAILTGGVEIGEGAHIGAGATVIPLKKIGQWSVVGAGSVILDHIGELSTAVGIPARILKRK